MVRNEEIETIKERMTKYIEFYKSVKTNLEKINDKVMDFDKKVYNKRFNEFFKNNHTDDISIWICDDRFLTIRERLHYIIGCDIYLENFTYTPDEGTMARIDGKQVKKVISDYIENLEKTIEQMTEEKNNIEKIIKDLKTMYENLEKYGKSLNFRTSRIIADEVHFTLIYGDFR